MLRLHGLDALRGVAALAVFLHHLCHYYFLPDLLPIAGRSVDLFFALSGFVMARTYDTKLREGLGATRFLLKRYNRLAPCAFIGGGIGLVFAMATGYFPNHIVVAGVIGTILFLPVPIGAFTYPLNGAAWSLTVELFLNWVHGAFLVRSERLWLVLAVAIALYAVIAWRDGGTHSLSSLAYLPNTLLRGLACYVIGVILYRTCGDRALWRSAAPAVIAFPFVTAALQYALEDWVASLVFLGLIPVFIRGTLGEMPAAIGGVLGGLSYPLYATHFPIILFSRALGISPLGTTAICLAVAALLMLTVEAARTGKGKTSAPEKMRTPHPG